MYPGWLAQVSGNELAKTGSLESLVFVILIADEQTKQTIGLSGTL